MTDQAAIDFAIEKYREYLTAIDHDWVCWIAAVDRLSTTEIHASGTCGDWSVRDLIAHIAAWDHEAIEKIHGIFEDALPPEDDESLDQFNERTLEASRGFELDVLQERMTSTHSKLIATLEGASNQPTDILERIEWATADDTWKHYNQHIEQIEVRFPQRTTRP